MFKSKHMYVKLLKKWGGHKEGDVIRFGRTKGEGRIALGEGVEVKQPRAVKDTPVVERAVVKPKTEKAVVLTSPGNGKAEVKANAEAKRSPRRSAAESAYKVNEENEKDGDQDVGRK